MLNLKSVFTTFAVISSILIPQSIMAYPKADRDVEIDFLKANFENLHGIMNAEIANYIESKYDENDYNIDRMLAGGYSVCDGMKQASYQGIDKQTLIDEGISMLFSGNNNALQVQGVSLTKKQIIETYNIAHSHLCPEIY